MFEGLGFLCAQQLRQLKDQILIMKAGVLGAGGAVVWRDAVNAVNAVNAVSSCHFHKLGKAWSTRIG